MPPRRKKGGGHIPVEALTHEEKRLNIPTADAVGFVAASMKEPLKLKYPRDAALDPQLVWRGKDEQNEADLLVDAPPLYIQEKIDPRVLVDTLKRTTSQADPEPELTLFEAFDGLDDWQSIEYYQHSANWSNRMILGDSLQVMASLSERESLRGRVQMVFLDPPYGIKFSSNWQTTSRSADVRERVEDATREVEQIKAFRDTWELGIHSYLTYLRDRLQIARELLTETGSIFLQISDENLHLVRSLMDEVFGSENAIATIPFRKKTMPFGTTYVEQMADFIVWYAKSSYVNGRPNAKYRKLYRSDPSVAGYNWVDLPDGNRMSVTEAVRTFGSVPEGSRYFTSKSLEPSGPMQSGMFRPVFEGKEYSYPRNGYGTTPEGLERLAAARRLIPAGNLLRYVLYADDKPLGDLTVPWMDTVGADDKRYVVQTNTRVVERCMLMTTDPGDLVLDPTCGSGTTAMVAEKWGRRWITVDTSRVALMVARQRLATAVHPSFELAQEATNAGQATDPRVGFRYRTVPHVTLKSIASNENIRPGMTASQVSEAIAKTADTETLYDQPLARSGVVRVTGPFTVETQAPHLEMSLARESAPDKEQAFVQGVLDNLRTSGVQSGVRDRRIEFTSSETVAGRFLVAEMRGTTTASNSARVAVSIGPRYGVVGSDWVKGAAREALAGVGYDMLLVLGFAFDPFAAETASAVSSSSKAAFQAQGEKRIGDMPVLLVRMNADLAMGQDLLRKSKNANLFTMFGEPDCTVQQEAGGWVVEVNGFDIYNPVSGEIESGDASNIAMWLLDTDYDGQSFCVRQLHFPGQTAYQKLSRALKAEIDPHEWQGYAGTRSRHFPDPSNGRIAIKIINDYGDEILTTRDLRRT